MRARNAISVQGHVLSLLTFAGTIVGAVLVFLAIAEINEYQLQRELTSAREKFSDAVHDRIELYQYGLRGMRGAVIGAGTKEFDRETMLAYSRSRDVEAEFRGARGFGVIKRVPLNREVEFVEEARRDGWPTFQINMLTPHEQERFVIQYIEPADRNMAAVGLDIGSEARRRQAAMEAVSLNGTALTAPITLVQATGARLRSFLALLPIFEPGLPLETEEQRMRAVMGWAYAPLVLDEVLEGIANNFPHLNWQIADVTDASNHMPIMERWQATSEAGVVDELTFSVFNRIWALRVQATPAFSAQLQQVSPWFAAFSTLTVGLLLTALLLQRQRSAARQRAQMRERAKLATIVDNTTQAAIGHDTAGNVVVWNRAAVELLNLAEQVTLGRPLDQVLEQTSNSVRSGIKTGAQALQEEHEVIVRNPDGSEGVFSVSRSEILDQDGTCTGQAYLLQDITRRREAEQALARQNEQLELRVNERTEALQLAERQLRTVFDAVPVAIAHWDAGHRIRVVNRAFVRFANTIADPLDLAGMQVDRFLQPDLMERIGSGRDFYNSLQVVKTECHFPERQGEDARSYEVTVIPDAENDQLLGYYLVARDITELKEGQRALEAALTVQETERQRLESILEGTNVGTWEWNVQTGQTCFNERWAHIIGYTLEEIAPTNIQTWLKYAHPADLESSGQLLESHFRGDTDFYECEARMRHRGGHWVWVLDRGRVLSHTSDGKPEWMFGTHQDITRRKSIEQALRRSEDFLTRVATIAGTGGWAYDMETGTVSWSKGIRQLSEVDEDFVVTLESGMAFYPKEAREQVSRAVSAALEDGRSFDISAPYVTAKGNARWVRAAGDCERDAQGKIVGLIGAIQDITRQHEDAEALRQAKVAADSSNRAKSQFLANMSHEIRTPLNAMLGIHHMLEGTSIDPHQRGLLGKAVRAGEGLMDIINDVLDLAKIEAGEMSLVVEPFQPRTLLNDLVDVYGPGASQKGVLLTVHVDDELPQWVEADRVRLRQVLSNLIGNAIKFTTKGTVDISSHALVAPVPGSPSWCVKVRDSGIGMAPETLEKLFKPFSQEDDSITRRFGGTGLGLSIAKNLAQLMRGDISVTSERGAGTEFVVTLPLVQATDNASQLAMLAATPITIGVLSEDEAVHGTLTGLFNRAGWRGVDLRLEQRTSVDLVFLDAAFGEPAGGPMAKVWEQLARDADWPTVLLSNEELPSDVLGDRETPRKQLRRDANSSDFFNAAVEMLAVKENIQDRLIHNNHALGVGIRWLNGVNILVVDDSELNQEIAVGFLRQQGAICHTCNNGLEAVEWLKSEAAAVDAVLMDIQMPVMDGLQATRQIRRMEKLSQLPVLALTAGVLESEKQRAREAGLSAFLSKPLEPLAVVKMLLKHIRPRLGTRALLELDAATPGMPPEGDVWPVIEGIDTEVARDRAVGNGALFRKLLPVFIHNYADWHRQALELLAAPERDVKTELASHLHKLRGSAGAVGADRLAEVALKAERSLEVPDVEVEALINEVARPLDSLLQSLRLHCEAQALTDLPVLGASGGRLPESSQVQYEHLTQLMRSNDLDAIDALDELMPALIRWVGTDLAKTLSERVNRLDFAAALDWIAKRESELQA